MFFFFFFFFFCSGEVLTGSPEIPHIENDVSSFATEVGTIKSKYEQ